MLGRGPVTVELMRTEQPAQSESGGRVAVALGSKRLAALLVLAALLHTVLLCRQVAPRFSRLDFSSYYVSALAMREGLDPYSANLLTFGDKLGLDVGAMIHVGETPTLLMCLEPLTTMSPLAAHRTWMTVNLVLFAASLWMLLYPFRELSPTTAISLSAITILFPPIEQNFIWAQCQVVVLFLLVVMMRSLQRRNDILVGAAVATAGLLRAYPLLVVIYLLLRNRRRALAWTAFFFALGVTITAGVVGLDSWINWLRIIFWNTGYWQSGLAFDIALGPFISRLFWYAFGINLSFAVNLARITTILAAVSAIVVLVIRATPPASIRDVDLRAFGLWVAAAILLSPIAWPHYMVLLIIPFIMLAGSAVAGRASRRAVLAAATTFVASAIWLGLWAKLEPHVIAGSSSPESIPIVLFAEMGFPIMMLGFVAAYWFAIDIAREDREPLGRDSLEKSQRIVGQDRALFI